MKSNPPPPIHRVLRPSPLPPFPPLAAAKSLAGLLRRQKFNIAVTLRWLYVLTVSSLCSDNVLLSKSDSAKRRLSGFLVMENLRIREIISYSSSPLSFILRDPRTAVSFLHRGNSLYERLGFIRVKRMCHESSTRVID